MEVRRQDFEREILHGCQENSWGGEKKSYYGVLTWKRNDIKGFFSFENS